MRNGKTKGASLTEYAFLVGFITLATVGAVIRVGDIIWENFGFYNDTLDRAFDRPLDGEEAPVEPPVDAGG